MDKKINLFVEPAEFFKERIVETMEKQKFSTTELAEFYLVELLARFMFSSNLFESLDAEHRSKEDPLAIILLKSQSSQIDLNEKIKMLKKLGDTALYISGFFGDSLNRKIIDLDYYREMGSIAYKSLSGAIRDDSFQGLYRELCEKFNGFVDVLTEISQETFIQNNRNLLRLYDFYQRTGSVTAKRQLTDRGLPLPTINPNIIEKKSKN